MELITVIIDEDLFVLYICTLCQAIVNPKSCFYHTSIK